ncbi:MAG: diacylglycerol kinase family protein [Coriobacteriia bacterium]|nr:diacylglycerol kinase family protein [Coriobacteriia bacterium]
MRILIVHNPKSGSGQSALFDYINDLVDSGVEELVIRNILSNKENFEFFKDAKDFDLIVLSGGDGTLASLNYELKYSDIPVQVFPSGTANLIAQNLNNDHEPVAMAQAALALESEYFDMGELCYTEADGSKTKIGFSMIAGIGFDAKIMQDSENLKKTMGQAAYVTAALTNVSPQTATFTLTLDGKVEVVEGIAVLIVNFADLAQRISLINEASPQDGLFHIVVLKAGKTIELLPSILNALFETNNRPNFEIFTAKEVAIDSDQALPIQFDGDVIEGASTPFSARVLENASRFIVDKNSPYYKKQD